MIRGAAEPCLSIQSSLVRRSTGYYRIWVTNEGGELHFTWSSMVVTHLTER